MARLEGRVYTVASDSRPNVSYRVWIDPSPNELHTCNCPQFRNRWWERPCKHIKNILNLIELVKQSTQSQSATAVVSAGDKWPGNRDWIAWHGTLQACAKFHAFGQGDPDHECWTATARATAGV